MTVTGYGTDGATLETDHNPVYAASYEDKEPESGGSDRVLLMDAAVCAAFLLVLAAAVIIGNKTRASCPQTGLRGP